MASARSQTASVTLSTASEPDLQLRFLGWTDFKGTEGCEAECLHPPNRAEVTKLSPWSLQLV